MKSDKAVKSDDSKKMKTPYFNEENKFFEPLIGFPPEQLSKDIKNYIYRPDADYFGEHIPNPYPGILDILVAPIYIVPSKNKASTDYSSTLTDHFFALFPDSKTYGAIIKKSCSEMEELILAVPEYFSEKNEIIVFIDERQKSPTNIRFKLKTLDRSFPQAAYVREAIKWTIIMWQTWENLKDQVILKEGFELKNAYFSRWPYQSDIENPLRFFTQIIGRNGLDKHFLKNSFVNNDTENIQKLIQVLDNNYRNETRKSLRLIKKKVDGAESRAEERKIKLEIITSLNSLYRRSRAHEIAGIYRNHLLPYRIIAAALIKEYSESKLEEKIEFNYKPDKIFETEEFLDELMNLRIKGRHDQSKSFADIHTPRESIEHLLNGQLKEITEPICVPWAKYPFYYLLQRLKDEKAPIVLENLAEHIVFTNDTKDEKPIVAGNISRYTSKHFDDHKRDGKFPEIDSLFDR